MSDAARDRTPWAADLLLAMVATGIGAAVVWVDLWFTSVRVLFAVLLVLILPGYAFVSALFPMRDSRASYPRRDNRPLGFPERFALGVLASATIVPTIAFGLNFTPYGINVRPLLLAVVGVTLLFLLLALVRRLLVPPEERYRAPLGALGTLPVYLRVERDQAEDASSPLIPRSEGQLFLNVILLICVVVLLGSVGFAMISPPTDEGFTEFYLVMEDEDGAYVAHGYPDTVGEAQGTPVHVAIGNEEGGAVGYTVVVVMQSVDDETDATDAEVLEQFEVTVDDGETEVTPFELADDPYGDDSRLVFLLYSGEPAEDPSPENAHRTVSLDLSG